MNEKNSITQVRASIQALEAKYWSSNRLVGAPVVPQINLPLANIQPQQGLRPSALQSTNGETTQTSDTLLHPRFMSPEHDHTITETHTPLEPHDHNHWHNSIEQPTDDTGQEIHMPSTSSLEFVFHAQSSGGATHSTSIGQVALQHHVNQPIQERSLKRRRMEDTIQLRKQRTCRKCAQSGCPGAGRVGYCSNPCQDCRDKECQGQNPKRPKQQCKVAWD